MRPSPLLPDEQQRLDALQLLGILDPPAEERFDRITRLAQRALGVPIALISLIDSNRQWFKSRQGLGVSETERRVSFCGHAIADSALFEVPDAHMDERFDDNPLVTGAPFVRFYAGRPLVAHGRRVGTLCVIDSQPRLLSSEDRAFLEDLAALAESELVLATRDTTDGLTGLSNRQGLLRIGDAMRRGRRPDEANGLLCRFQLTGMTTLQQYLGAVAAERATAGFARTLLSVLPEGSLPARLDDGSFVAVLPGGTGADVPALLADLRSCLATAFATGAFPGRFDVAVAHLPWVVQDELGGQVAALETLRPTA